MPPRLSAAVSTAVFLTICGAAWGRGGAPSEGVRHDLQVRLLPAEHRLEVRDRLQLRSVASGEVPEYAFRLHDGLAPRVVDPGWRLEEGDLFPGAEVPLRAYRLVAEEAAEEHGAPTVELRYGGVIHHVVAGGGPEYSRSFSSSPGLVDERGVVLSASCGWFPNGEESLVRFDLLALAPAGWEVVSQGERTRHEMLLDEQLVAWHSPEPMDDIYLIAAPFTEFSRPAGGVTAQAFLREPDPNLAARYLEATAQYLEMYGRLIGPYPYTKFALVENFWETGYGMPSFTLLGPRIIRFPFILHSSYPHEILHNWWGNSVFVDYESGNWCEGLTAYLADHLIREGQGRGAEYRRDTLNAYRSYVLAERDFPLTEFRSRHSAATQAVGYGKCLMMWHMLRRELGDDAFSRGLARFYRQHRYRIASFADVARVFGEVAERDLSGFFAQWVERTGAPELELEVAPPTTAQRARVVVRQRQAGESYDLTVPVALTYRDRPEAELVEVRCRPEGSVEIADFETLLRVDVDPRFDVFRRLDAHEIPPTFARLFGAARVTLVLPEADAIATEQWHRFAESWAERGDVEIVAAAKLSELPRDRAIWLLGADNRWVRRVAASIAEYGAALGEQRIRFGVSDVPREDHCFAFAAPHPDNDELAIGWIGAQRADALPGLARKLPHYGKYSFLAFAGAEPTNDAKGQWPTVGSPLVWTRAGAGTIARGATPREEPLARLQPVFDPERLFAHVRVLADDGMEGRGVGTAGLERAADYIAGEFQRLGLEPAAADGSYFEVLRAEDGPDGGTVTLRNVVGVLRGSDSEWATQSVVLGAHYDHLGRGWPDVRAGEQGKIHNGADDNASGVAVLLEVAGLLQRTLEPRRSIIFVAFAGEEWGRCGSRHFVRTEHPPYVIGDTLAMINLDTVGRLDGAKLTVFGAGSASEWPHVAMGIGFTTGVESNAVQEDPGASDHVSFHEVGIPAVHLFSGAHEDYHRSTDDSEKIDRAGLVRVATWVREALVYLQERPEPFHAQLSGMAASAAEASAAPKPAAGRRAALGTLPDFQDPGPGVRVARVITGGAAERAGVRAGDRLVEFDGVELADLRAYSDALKARAPGDRVRLVVVRAGQRVELEAVLTAR